MKTTLLNKLIIIGTDYLDFREGQDNLLLFMLCWIVRLYHRIGRIEETELTGTGDNLAGHFGDLFICASDPQSDQESRTSQQIVCRNFLVHLYLMVLFQNL